MWRGFVFIVLGLSGVEAIANLTGVMRRPVAATAKRAIWPVAIEVALFNLVLAVIMVSLASAQSSPLGEPLARDAHTEDMLAFMARAYIGTWGEWAVRIIGGLLLLSATNTAVNGLMSVVYVMSRDRELPAILQKLNGFGSPWVAAVVAASVPALVLLFAHDLRTLAALYAIGVVGAIAIDVSLSGLHPRLRKWYRKVPMIALALLLIAIWITLATTKIEALIFVTVVLAVGLSARRFTQWTQARRPKPTLLRQAIVEQLTPEALAKPKLLLATAGSDAMAAPAMAAAKAAGAALVVCFVREVALSYKISDEGRLTIDTDPAAQELFTEFLEHGHREGVPIIPMYDTGTSAAEMIAEHAAINAVSKVLIGTSRRGAFHKLVKGSFQKKLESLLPPEIEVVVLSAPANA
jgi:amino acid transporter